MTTLTTLTNAKEVVRVVRVVIVFSLLPIYCTFSRLYNGKKVTAHSLDYTMEKR